MRKKTIKSYFCKNLHRNPSISTLFCFSKRAIKYRKQLNKGTKLSKQTSNRYKFYINNLVLYNQWVANKYILRDLFANSFYIDKSLLTNIKCKKTYFNLQVYLWYKLMNTYKINLNKSLIQYPKTGMLSSHFVHFLSKKNITYQTRSKYRSKNFNMNPIYYYLYIYTNMLYVYLYLLDWKLYFFTCNISKQRVTTDIDFDINISNWNSIVSKYVSNTQINRVDYTLDDYNIINNNEIIISSYLNEPDVHKKEALLKYINELNNNLGDIVPLNQLSYRFGIKHCGNNNTCLNDFNKLYLYL